MSLATSRWLGILAMATLVGGACAPARPNASVPNDLVLVETAHGLAAFDWARGRLAYETSTAVPTPDWSQLAVGAPGAAQATLNVLDGLSGAQMASVDVPAGLAPMAVSSDGRLVALGPASGGRGQQDGGRTETRLVIADPSGAVAPRVFGLPGNYEPDAFANDGQHLFVLEYVPPLAPDRYRVRSLDLKTGAVSGVGSRLKTAVPEEEMRGTRRTHVLSPDRQTLYTLYTNQPEHLHSRDLAAGRTRSSGDVAAFVHVLNLAEGWAFCLDLPSPFGEGPASAHALALSADGRSLYVTDRSSGRVARADTTQLAIREIVDVGVDPQAGSVSAAAQVGPDGSLFLSSSSELVVLEPRTLAVQRRLPMAVTPTGLGVSLDGRRLFVSTAVRLLAIDPLTGTELGGFAIAGAQRIQHVAQL